MKNNLYVRIIPALLAVFLSFPSYASAQTFPSVPGIDIGTFSLGAGLYQAPSGADSDSGLYGLARYEISSFEFEIDYGLTGKNFFLGAADYLYYFPTAEGITKTAISLGGGITFVSDDPSKSDTKFGPNVLGQVRVLDNYSVQVRYDFLGSGANLWTFGVSIIMN